jgi:hypothetical protein
MKSFHCAKLTKHMHVIVWRSTHLTLLLQNESCDTLNQLLRKEILQIEIQLWCVADRVELL